MGGGKNGRVRLDQLKKDLEYTLPQPKELGLDPGDAGEPGTGLSRRVWPGPICSGWAGGRAWRLGEQPGLAARGGKAQT